jgi:AraC-like DNA-binding protein
MLRHLTRGTRYFGDHPMSMISRINWEFYAVIKGWCAPLKSPQENDRKEKMCEQTLWIFPPEDIHGWFGIPGQSCEIVAFHFGTVPHQLENYVRSVGYISHKLSLPEIKRITQMCDKLHHDHKNPNVLSPLKAQQVLIELSLIVLDESKNIRTSNLNSAASEKVEEAIAAYYKHVDEHPTAEQIALKVNVSVSHLRRLFWQVRGENPKAAFRRITMERAMELMSNSTDKLEDIAEKCGFSGSAEFGRAFKKHYHVPPAIWRKSILPTYKDPITVKGKSLYPNENLPVHKKLLPYISKQT